MEQDSNLGQGFSNERDETANVAEYWQIISAKRWLVLSATGLGMLLSIFYISLLPNIYTATDKILVEKVEAGTSKVHQEMVLPSSRGEEDYYGTQVAILTSQNIAKIVASELELNTPYTISAKLIRGTRIISVSVKHRNPEWAAKIANKFAEVYVRESAHEKLFMSRQLLQWIPEENELMSKNVTGNAEPSMSMAPAQDAGDLDKKEFVESLSSVMNDPIVREMKSEKLKVEAELKELSQRYKSGHPNIKELNERLGFVDHEIGDRTRKIVGNLKANLSGEFNVNNIKILEEAVAPARPSEPNRPQGIFLGTMLGFISGVSLAFFSEYSNQKIRIEKDLHSGIHTPFLGYIPLIKGFSKKLTGKFSANHPPLVDVMAGDSVLSDAVASVRTHILFSMPYEKSKRIMLTSAVPSEGKTTTAVLMALSLTTLGRKILLIDADMRKPSSHNCLKIKKEKGLADYLIGAASAEEVIQSVPGSALKAVAAGGNTPNPAELLASDRFRDLLDYASQQFDRVVIDVPPVLYIPDGLIVAKHIHSGVLVCGAGMVDKKAVKAVIDKFEAIGHAFIGIIINRADYEDQGYRFKYYKTYKSYYTKSGVRR